MTVQVEDANNMEKINKKYCFELLTIFGILSFLFVLPMISAGFSSNYYAGNPATIGPGETKTAELLTLLSGANEANNGNLTYKVEITNGAGIATLEGNNVFSITPTQPAPIKVKLSVSSNTHEGTEFNITFKISDITPTESGGMIGFAKTSTFTMPVLVRTPPPTPTPTPSTTPVEQPKGSIAWVIIVLVLAVIIAIVAFLFLKRKKTA